MNIIIFSTNSWNSPLKYQRHHLAEYLAGQESVDNVYFCSKAVIRRAKVYDFISLFLGKLLHAKTTQQRELPSKITPVSFLLLPYQPFCGVINKFLKKQLLRKLNRVVFASKKTIIISYQPFPELLELVDKVKPTAAIYISVHDYEHMKGVMADVYRVEQEIVRRVDLFTTDSSTLYEKITQKNISTRLISLAPACPLSVVNASKESLTPAHDAKIQKIIYFGTLAQYLDWNILRRLECAGYIVDFMGVEYDIKLEQEMSSSTLHSARDFETASKILARYDAIILPYQNNARNEHVIPAKIYECFSLGKPIFAPAMQWTKDKDISPFIFTYNDEGELLAKMSNFDFSDFQEVRDSMLQTAECNTWDKRFSPLMQFIAEAKQ